METDLKWFNQEYFKVKVYVIVFSLGQKYQGLTSPRWWRKRPSHKDQQPPTTINNQIAIHKQKEICESSHYKSSVTQCNKQKQKQNPTKKPPINQPNK